MKLLKRFWAWYTDPKVMGDGTCIGDWLDEQEKSEFLNGPSTPGAFNYWLAIAQNRKESAKTGRYAINVLAAIIVAVLGCYLLGPFK